MGTQQHPTRLSKPVQSEEQKGREEGELIVEEGRPVLKEPPRFAVLLHNDDYTTMEFVVQVLRKYFQKQEPEAMQIMLQIHKGGHGVAGIYDWEIAETKVVQVHGYARSQGFPLRCSTEKVDSV
jgi:ATP-dependent Clp protease adaptor protein ClpS